MGHSGAPLHFTCRINHINIENSKYFSNLSKTPLLSLTISAILHLLKGSKPPQLKNVFNEGLVGRLPALLWVLLSPGGLGDLCRPFLPAHPAAQ